MSQHLDQVASVLQRAIQAVLSRGLNDPRVRGLVSVTGVDLSSDLMQAVVRVSVLPEEHAELTMHGLRSATKHVRSSIARTVELRRVPKLVFKLDTSLKNEAAVQAAINQARRKDDGVPESLEDIEP
ncbi:MAG: 30S ribosome-binding factor RbfA [Planctomycetota bacterium]|jgi:ribosome-binding factor A